MSIFKKLRYQRLIIKIFHWEHWPFHLVYAPIYFYWLWLCLKSRSFFFFNTANPSIQNGGFLMESKMQIYNLLPDGSYPATIFFKSNTTIDLISSQIGANGLQFPLVGKPDIGMRGIGVQQLHNMEEVKRYSQSSKVDFLLQNFVSAENEVGIFYYRYPGELTGHISGIVQKEFLKVTGDASSTISDLLRKDARFILQLPVLQKEYGHVLQTVLPAGKEFLMVPYGNHSRGAKFIDASDRIDEALRGAVDHVCRQVKGFYFGRLDIRYNTWEELTAGKFSIIELNGAGSEPAHIYDPRHSLLFAWKEIIRHHDIMYRISRKNHLVKMLPYMNIRKGIEMLRENNTYLKKLSQTA